MGIKGMKNKLVYAIVAVAFVGGIFATAYAGPILTTITFAGNTETLGDAQIDGDLNVDGKVTGDGTIGSLSCNTTQVIRWNGFQWECANILAVNNPVYTLDSVGVVGQHTSIAIGASGQPVVSYYDATKADLKIIDCGDASCTSPTIRTIDSTGVVGQYSSLVIDLDGHPVLSYYDATNQNLKYAHCDDATCSTSTIRTIDSTGNVGQYSSIVLGKFCNASVCSEFPVISYHDATNGDLKLAFCGQDLLCPSPTITAVDSTAGHNVGRYSSITIVQGFFPAVSYYDATTGDLKFLRCIDSGCIGKYVGQFSSMANAGGFDALAISYYDVSNGDLKFVHCSGPNCSSPTITTLDSPTVVGQHTSVAMGKNGLAVISYYDASNGDLNVMRCSQFGCSGINGVDVVDSIGVVGQFSSIATGDDGQVYVSYYDVTNGDLKLAIEGIVVSFG